MNSIVNAKDGRRKNEKILLLRRVVRSYHQRSAKMPTMRQRMEKKRMKCLFCKKNERYVGKVTNNLYPGCWDCEKKNHDEVLRQMGIEPNEN